MTEEQLTQMWHSLTPELKLALARLVHFNGYCVSDHCSGRSHIIGQCTDHSRLNTVPCSCDCHLDYDYKHLAIAIEAEQDKETDNHPHLHLL